MNWFIMIFSIKNGRKFRGPVVHTPVSDMKYPMNSTCSIRFYPEITMLLVKSHVIPAEISAETWHSHGKTMVEQRII